MTKILAFAGRKQSGKDTLGEEAVRLLPGARVYHFAGLLKAVCHAVFGTPFDLLWGDDAAKDTMTGVRRIDGSGPLTVRELLQYFGTEVCRAMMYGVWPVALMRQIEEDNPTHAIIADCRFPDEVAAVKARFGKVVRLTRRGGAADYHESERALDPDRFDWSQFDGVIANAHMNKAEQAAELANLLKLWGWL